MLFLLQKEDNEIKYIEIFTEWCADNYTTFANYKATKEEWMKMLGNGLVYHQEGNCTFI